MRWAKQKGFTIVELLIVIVVIGVLTAISIVAYTGIQQRARDAQRKSDVANIVKALEMYYNDKGRYPGSPGETGGSNTINTGWSTTADGSWQKLVTALDPYVKGIGKDPVSTPAASVLTATGYNYAYFASASAYCGAAPYQMYILVYQFESAPREGVLQGACPSDPLHYSSASVYRVVK